MILLRIMLPTDIICQRMRCRRSRGPTMALQHTILTIIQHTILTDTETYSPDADFIPELQHPGKCHRQGLRRRSQTVDLRFARRRQSARYAGFRTPETRPEERGGRRRRKSLLGPTGPRNRRPSKRRRQTGTPRRSPRGSKPSPVSPRARLMSRGDCCGPGASTCFGWTKK